MRLRDKVAVVTGAGRGIGQAIALAYAREGAHVVVNDIDPATAEATAAEATRVGSKSLAVAADIAKPADIARLSETTVRERGRVDIVVNNAVKTVPGKLGELTEASEGTTMRSEERREGKGGRARGAPKHYKRKRENSDEA